MANKIFIVGTGRCGTMSVAELLSHNSEILCLHEGRGLIRGNRVELHEDFKDINKSIYYSKNATEQVESTYRLTEKFNKIIGNKFDSRKMMIESLRDNEIFCDINPYGHSLINFINNKYPDCKFIHLIRNGYDVVESYYARPNTYPDGDESRYTGYQSGKPRPTSTDPLFYKWTSFSRLQKTSWFWMFVNESIQNRLSGVENHRKVVFRLEDLASSTDGLANFIGTTIRAPFPKANKNKYNPTLSWNEKTIGQFNEICAPTMTKFGYALR